MMAWTMGGLETLLFTCLLTCATVSFINELEDTPQRRFAWSGVWFALLALTRPEGIAFGVLAIAFSAWLNRRNHATVSSTSSLTLRAAVILGVFALHEVWRLSYYGTLIPNTVVAKSMSAFPLRAMIEGAYYIFHALSWAGGFVVALFVAMLFLARRRRTYVWFILLELAMWCVMMLISGGDWMPMQRFAVHVFPLLAILMHAGLDALLTVNGAHSVRVALVGALVAQIVFSVFSAIDERVVRGVGASAILNNIDAVTQKTTPLLKSGDVVAVGDAGIIPYHLPLGVRVIDMAGLTDAHIAHVTPRFPRGLFGRGDGFGKWDVEYVLAARPRIVQATGLRRDADGTWTTYFTGTDLLVNDPRFAASYRWLGADDARLSELFVRIAD
jgi:hypothetical protein